MIQMRDRLILIRVTLNIKINDHLLPVTLIYSNLSTVMFNDLNPNPNRNPKHKKLNGHLLIITCTINLTTVRLMSNDLFF